jgi:hypothetical protein
MPTLVLSPRYTPDSIALWRAAIEAGWDVHRLTGWRIEGDLRLDEPVFSDEPLLAILAAERLGVALLEPTFDWLTRLPSRYLRRELSFLSLAEARSLPGPVFLKPADDKCFPAKVYASGAALPALPHLPPSTPVLASEPVHFEVEYRAFVAGRKLSTISPYVREGDIARGEDGAWRALHGEEEEATALLEELLLDVGTPIPPAAVVDVGRIRGRGWAVVEANPAWGAGICACDPARVLPVLRRACVARDKLSAEDAAWVVARGGLQGRERFTRGPGVCHNAGPCDLLPGSF